MRRTDKLLLGVAALTMFCLNPLESSAEVRMRFDGTQCQPSYGPDAQIHVSANSGLMWSVGAGAARGGGATCPIPTGRSLVSLSSGSENRIGTVNAYFHQTASAQVATQVIVHDYDAFDFCTCGSNLAASSGYFQRSMPFNCGACSYGTDWAINMIVEPFNPQGVNLTLRLITVHDTDS